MKKVILAAALLVAGVSVANAEGYNRVAVSYDHTNLSFNKDAASFLDADGSETAGLNGFGLNYIHGFGVAENMFVETGANVDFLLAISRLRNQRMATGGKININSRTSIFRFL